MLQEEDISETFQTLFRQNPSKSERSKLTAQITRVEQAPVYIYIYISYPMLSINKYSSTVQSQSRRCENIFREDFSKNIFEIFIINKQLLHKHSITKYYY